MLLYLYVVALVVGGILLTATLFLGGDHGDGGGHDLDGGGDLDGADLDVDDVGHGGDGHGGDGTGHADVWLPVLSLRFWVFFLAFFGLTGTALTGLSLAGPWATLASASGLGLGAGLGASWILRRLGRTGADGVTRARDLRGREATVLLPMEPGERGKVRLLMPGGTVDMVARSTDDRPLARGRTVVVYDFEDDVALVVSAPELEP